MPPNVFDDFIRATDTEYVDRIVGADARARQATERAEEAQASARSAEIHAVEAAAQGARMEAQALQANADVRLAEARAANVEMRAAEAEARAAEAEARAAEAEARAADAEARAADAEACTAIATADAAAFRRSTSWRVTKPLRIVRWLLNAHVGAALIEAGIAPDRVEHLKSISGMAASRARRLVSLSAFMRWHRHPPSQLDDQSSVTPSDVFQAAPLGAALVLRI